VSDGAEYQPKGNYPPTFLLAVPPGEVTTAFCEHEADPPVCNCVHDWRINWGNVERRNTARSAVL
jgi:hypothetical protein